MSDPAQRQATAHVEARMTALLLYQELLTDSPIDAVTRLAHALAEARREGLEEAAKVVNGLMGKDSGNWNRAIIYAEAAIRAKAKEPAHAQREE